MACLSLALHYLLFIFDWRKVKLALRRNFQAWLRLIN